MRDSGKKRILIIEDEVHISDGLKLNLNHLGYEVKIAEDGGKGLDLWKSWSPHLIVLDIMLPVIDGLSVLRSIRLEDDRIPVLILSAKGTPEDKVKGLSFGSDDYLAKPFNLDEFLLRVDRLITRISWNTNYNPDSAFIALIGKTFSFGNNTIDFKTSTVQCDRGKIPLTNQEIKLLKLFILNRGTPLSRKKLLEIGWGYHGETSTRTIDNFMVRLRKYFEKNPQKPHFFKSVRSVGYVFI